MKRYLMALGSAVAVTFAVSAAEPAKYTLTVPLTDDEDGLTAYIIDFDTSEKLDSTVVEDGKAFFRGTVETPVFARVILDGNRAGMLVLEEGNITLNDAKIGIGTPVNDAFCNLTQAQQQKLNEFQALPKDATDSQKQAIIDAYNKLAVDALDANINNPLGYYLFLQESYNWDYPTFESKLAQNPAMANYKRIQTLKQGLLNKEETSVGHKYKDFEITFEGETKRLSDYVGKGKYTLVDFWASWCGPCIRETKVLKELWNKYHDRGLDFLGVAVWDDPANTRRAIQQHELPWPQILNAQTIPTDLYGIPGIPCIILFDPEGNIVSRDQQDEALVADVDAAMANVIK